MWRPALALFLVLTFCIPFNAMTMQTLSYEEALLGFVVPIALGLGILSPGPWRSVVLALLIAAMYLTKSSMLLVCVWLALMATLDPRRAAIWQRVLPGAALVAAALAWGSFVEHRTGAFAIGSSASSNNGWNLLKGNNPRFAEFYPARHLDELSAELRAAAPSFGSEWEANAHYSEQARSFMRENPLEVVRNAGEKLHVLLVRVPDFDFNRNRISKIIVHDSGLIVNRILLWSAIILSATWIVRPGGTPLRRRAGVIFLGALAGTLAPYVVGFGYQRHMVPMFVSSILIVMMHDAFSRTRREAGQGRGTPV